MGGGWDITPHLFFPLCTLKIFLMLKVKFSIKSQFQKMSTLFIFQNEDGNWIDSYGFIKLYIHIHIFQIGDGKKEGRRDFLKELDK